MAVVDSIPEGADIDITIEASNGAGPVASTPENDGITAGKRTDHCLLQSILQVNN